MSDAIEFHHDDAGYAGWLRLHPHDGYVLTRVGRNWSLHNATCPAIDFADGASYTNNPKLCSTNRRALELEARERSGRSAIENCEQCGS